MEIRIYAFDFAKAVKKYACAYDGVEFKEYANRCIYELGCRSFMVFNNLPKDTNVKKFIDSTCTSVFELVRRFFLQNEEADVFIAYRVVDYVKEIDEVVDCL